MTTKTVTIFATALAMFTCCCNVEKPSEKEISLQLYSIRSQIGDSTKYAQNHEAVFAKLAEIGYTSVETANYKNGKFYGVSPEQFRSDVEAAGLKVLSAHSNRTLTKEELENGDLTAALAWWDEAIPAHKAAGMEFIVMPGMRRPSTLKHLETIVTYLNEIGKRCNESGMSFGYHNHQWEFERKINDKRIFDYLIENTDPQLVFFQMDVYWTVIGNASPVEYFKKHPGRFKLLHIKDYKEVGQSGMVGFDAIFNNADIAGFSNIIVELEGSTSGDIMKGCEESADYLLNAPFVKASYTEKEYPK